MVEHSNAQLAIRNDSVLSLGDLLLDLVVRYDPAIGEADAGPDGVQLWPGGSAANFAVWAARQGANVRFISRVGRDLAGEMLVRSLGEAGGGHSVRLVERSAAGGGVGAGDGDGA